MQRGSADRQPGEGRSLARLGPAAVIVTGPPASGKTTLATTLASSMRYAIVDLDTVTGPLTRAALRLSGGDEAAIDSPAGAALRAARYETLLDVAATNLAVGIGVVIAAPFTAERSSGEDFAEVVRRLGVGDCVSLVYIDTPEHIARSRLASRNAPRDRDKLMGQGDGTRSRAIPPAAIVVDGEKGLADQLRQVLDALHGTSKAAAC
ncbi:MAG TPA: AAA family ATPase [Solirubrobacteraceae bacterium]|nr:AAA family ATPase [Solirubrobacteraceae bacterium]